MQNIRAANWDGDDKTKAFECKVIFDILSTINAAPKNQRQRT
jgi:hypothetical protein